ncbi:MAG: hypothetical protein CMJ48_08135 [Planctomycetaceae bacterium]|nr:hypothetical protein [Planctomycetaceae bacterium]
MRVEAIGPCPPISEGEGNVVTGTFRDVEAGLVNVVVEGEAEPTVPACATKAREGGNVGMT